MLIEQYLFFFSIRVMFSIADLEEEPEFGEDQEEGEEENIGAMFPLRCSVTVTKVLSQFSTRHYYYVPDISLLRDTAKWCLGVRDDNNRG